MTLKKLDDDALYAYTKRRMVFTMLARLYEMPEGEQQRMAYGDRDSENAQYMNDDATCRAMIDRVCDDLMAEGLVEETEAGGSYFASGLMEERGIDMVDDEEGKQALLEYKLRMMAKNGTLAEALAGLSDRERAYAEQRWGSTVRVDFAVHEPRHEAAG